ncbi:RNA polymerase sporulation specific sigma factor SigK [Candidatus Syntrophocurvum alkaliphilum]|uniref:RNA polymerase sigma factor n=1 Tax=Candidatus Syntrophocurvum alkaliphilum TaxID=2293317 RepID=A0A6I6D6X6_9FIRM|nr:RNA polymerase sporulation sigma factor SigK [Candidatus Syntrophocurvum alkaliphilum]QGT98923.1 RNA polymerase sporulation specific sigma factor SigK [Candidatus Syntrophocurvum alkaliphilum]
MSLVYWALATVAIINGALFLVGYLSNQVFPQPLGEEDEKKYLNQLKNGSEDARNKLIEHNLRLVAHVVRKYETSGEDLEDLISIGTIGLIKAINTFKDDHGVRLATYSARCIENEVLMHLRNTKKVKQEVSIYDPIGYDKEGNEISLIDILTTDNEIVEIVEAKLQEEKIRSKMNILSKRERQVVEMRYGLFNGLKETQREIAKKLGISRSYVSRIEKRALRKLIKEISV